MPSEDMIIQNGGTPLPTTEQTVASELQSLTAMIDNPNCDFRNVLQQILAIMTLLHRMGCRENREYALNKELDMKIEVNNVKKTYNSWKVLTITIASGSLQILGGAVGAFGAIPGTIAGTGLASLAPKVFGFLGNAANAQKIASVSQAVTGVAQGTGAFGGIFHSGEEAERAVHQYALNYGQRKNEDSNRAYGEENQLGQGSLRNAHEAESVAHSTVTHLLETRT